MLLQIEQLAQSMPSISDPTLFHQSALWIDKHLDYANAMQLCLESESIKHANSSTALTTAIRAKDICKVGMLDDVAVNISFENGRTQATVMQDLSAWVTSDNPQMPSPLRNWGVEVAS